MFYFLRFLTVVLLLNIAVGRAQAQGDPQNVWVSALDFIFDMPGVNGASTPHQVLVAIAAYLHSGHGLTYDVNEGASHYIDKNTGEFLLTDYIAKSRGNVVNCQDQAAALQILSAAVGVNSQFVFMGYRRIWDPVTKQITDNGKPPFGFINTVVLVGEGLCNNPFYPDTTGGKITADPDETDPFVRSRLYNHAFVRHAGLIYDACAGPYLGTGNLQQYATATIDISDPIERLYSPDAVKWGGNEDGVFSTAEVDNALDLSYQPIKGIK